MKRGAPARLQFQKELFFCCSVPRIPWAFSMTEVCGMILCYIWILVLLLHKHRYSRFLRTETVWLISGCQAWFFPLHCPGRFPSAQCDVAFYKRKLGLWLRKVLRPIYYLIILWMFFIGERVVSLGPVLASLAFSCSSYLMFFLFLLFLSTFSFLLLQKQTRNTTSLEREKASKDSVRLGVWLEEGSPWSSYLPVLHIWDGDVAQWGEYFLVLLPQNAKGRLFSFFNHK